MFQGQNSYLVKTLNAGILVNSLYVVNLKLLKTFALKLFQYGRSQGEISGLSVS